VTSSGEQIKIRSLIDEVTYLRMINNYSSATAAYYRTHDDVQQSMMEESQKSLACYIKKMRQCKSGDCPMEYIMTCDNIQIGQQIYIIPQPIMALISSVKCSLKDN
jgi:hypothetical protein